LVAFCTIVTGTDADPSGEPLPPVPLNDCADRTTLPTGTFSGTLHVVTAPALAQLVEPVLTLNVTVVPFWAGVPLTDTTVRVIDWVAGEMNAECRRFEDVVTGVYWRNDTDSVAGATAADVVDDPEPPVSPGAWEPDPPPPPPHAFRAIALAVRPTQKATDRNLANIAIPS